MELLPHTHQFADDLAPHAPARAFSNPKVPLFKPRMIIATVPKRPFPSPRSSDVETVFPPSGALPPKSPLEDRRTSAGRAVRQLLLGQSNIPFFFFCFFCGVPLVLVLFFFFWRRCQVYEKHPKLQPSSRTSDSHGAESRDLLP